MNLVIIFAGFVVYFAWNRNKSRLSYFNLDLPGILFAYAQFKSQLLNGFNTPEHYYILGNQ